MFWLLLSSACTASRLSCFPTLPAPSKYACGGQEAGRRHSWTANSNCLKRHSIPCNVMVTKKTWGRRRRKWELSSKVAIAQTGWASVCSWEGIIVFASVVFYSSFLQLLRCLYLDLQKNFLTFSLPVFPHIALGWANEWLSVWVLSCWPRSTRDKYLSKYLVKRLLRNKDLLGASALPTSCPNDEMSEWCPNEGQDLC